VERKRHPAEPQVHADTLGLRSAGPFEYTGKPLDAAHEHLHITSEEFDEVGAEIQRALAHFNVPEREQQEVLGAIVARKEEVVNPSP